jgi:signal recognition particle subunit SRP54
MFDSLTEKLTGVFGRLSGKGKLSEQDIDEALREVRIALLEADVDFKVARTLIDAVRHRAVSEKVFASLTPGQTVVKIVGEEIARVLGAGLAPTTIALPADTGSDEPVAGAPAATPADQAARGASPALPAPAGARAATPPQTAPRTVAGLRRGDKPPSIILLAGLQGAGKTTTAAKLALRLKKEAKDRRAAPPVLMAACDLRRPAAIEQLIQLGKQLDIPVHHEPPQGNSAVAVAKRAAERAAREGIYWLILDTGGRLAIDDELMTELEQVRDAVKPVETLLVVDAMTGQDAVKSGGEFHRRLGLTGIIMTKMDGDARGGAALSMRAVTGLPIRFITVGEKPDGLEEFHPERIASRILGMGDVQTLIEKAQDQFDTDQTRKLEERLKKNQFDMTDLLEQFRALKKMGSLTDVLGMIPGLGGLRAKNAMQNVDERKLAQIEAIILSMTPGERANPKVINGSRRKRIADGSGTSPAQVNTLLEQFFQMQKMMKKLATPGGRRALAGMMRGVGR